LVEKLKAAVAALPKNQLGAIAALFPAVQKDGDAAARARLKAALDGVFFGVLEGKENKQVAGKNKKK
jgi:hypothetical protein